MIVLRKAYQLKSKTSARITLFLTTQRHLLSSFTMYSALVFSFGSLCQHVHAYNHVTGFRNLLLGFGLFAVEPLLGICRFAFLSCNRLESLHPRIHVPDCWLFIEQDEKEIQKTAFKQFKVLRTATEFRYGYKIVVCSINL